MAEKNKGVFDPEMFDPTPTGGKIATEGPLLNGLGENPSEMGATNDTKPWTSGAKSPCKGDM